MKTFFGILGGSLFIGLLMLVSVSPMASAGTAGQASWLPRSPLSGGVLMARAIHSGAVPPGHGPRANTRPQLTCSPAPCVLPNVQASGGNSPGTLPVNENPIAANPTNAQQLLTGGNDYNCTASLQGFYISSDGGSTWTSTCKKSALTGGCGDPGVGYDMLGTAYITGVDSKDGCQTGVVGFEKSTDNGMTWSKPAMAVNALFSNGLADKDWLQIDDTPTSPHANALYISATQFASNNNSEISVSHSKDGGTTWLTAAVDTVQGFPKLDQFSDLTIGKDGTVYVSWMRCTANGPAGDCGGTTATFWISKSADGGTTWSAPVQIASANLTPDTCNAFYGCLPNTSERVSNILSLAIDNSTGANAGHLYGAFYTYTGTYMKVEVTTSIDGGTTWNTPVGVASPSVTHDQFFPWLAVSANGRVGVTWLDRRNDPSNISYEAFAAFSRNGTIFRQNIQLASTLSNPNNDGFGGGFMGDYTGNIWVGTTLCVSWMDSRNGSTMQDEVGGYLRLK